VTAADAPQDLIDQTRNHVRSRLEAQQHAVQPEAPLSVEVEITSVGHKVTDGTNKICVRLTGRVVEKGQRFASVDTVKERCDVTRFTSGGTDPLSSALSFAAAVVKSIELEHAEASVEAKLYLGTLDELTDVLARQATRR
jgi:hypothetical protein